jgi:hypothetical protein
MTHPCPICSLEMDKVVVEQYVCHQPHNGPGPKIGTTATDCPVVKGSIWVHVIDDAGNNITGMNAKVKDTTKPTEAGFAPFDPLDVNSYKVEIGPLDTDQLLLYFPPARLDAPSVPVKKGEITSVQFVLERKAELKVIVKEEGADKFIPNIKVNLTGPEAREGTTLPDGTGSASFKNLHKGNYKVTITLSETDEVDYCLDGPDNKPAPVVPGQPNQCVFELKPIVWIKVLVKDPEQGAPALAGSIKVKKLDATSEDKNFPAGVATDPVEFKMKKQAGTCVIEQVLTNGDEIYELGTLDEA